MGCMLPVVAGKLPGLLAHALGLMLQVFPDGLGAVTWIPSLGWMQIIAYKVIFRVIPCDIRKVPLEDTTVDVAIFCLSLMATDASQFILEANRILRLGGKLLIAEVSSRIENTKKFVKTLGSYGFTLERDDTSNSHFVLFFLKKFRDSNDIKNRPPLTFRPCQYKKR